MTNSRYAIVEGEPNTFIILDGRRHRGIIYVPTEPDRLRQELNEWFVYTTAYIEAYNVRRKSLNPYSGQEITDNRTLTEREVLMSVYWG